MDWFLRKVHSVNVSFRKNSIIVYAIVFGDGSSVEAFYDDGHVFVWSRNFTDISKFAFHMNSADLECVWSRITNFNNNTTNATA